MTATEKRLKVRNKYRTILGRNKYSQPRRSYVFKKYSNGVYYSDCSSSVAACYRECGYPVTYGGSKLPNTVGIYNSKDCTKVPVKINSKTGVIENPEILRIGDMLLFAGTDSSRSGSGYVGHVEMVGEISDTGKITIYGHGSGTPRKTEMQAYCKSRRKRSASTKLGHRGLIKVVRRIQDDGNDSNNSSGSTNIPETPDSSLKLGDRILKNGCEGADVKELQLLLIELGYKCGSYGADGEFGDATEIAVMDFQLDHKPLDVDGEVGPKTLAALKDALETLQTASPGFHVQITGGDCYVRTAPNKETGRKLGVAHEGEMYPYGGEESADGWLLIEYKAQNAWVSGKYGRRV